MALQKLAPFESTALLYGLNPDNADQLKFYIRDDTFNICGRLLNTFGETSPEYEQCYSCAKDGMDTLTKLTGRSPCAYRIPRDIQTTQTSPYFEARKSGKSPDDSYECCLNSGADVKNCLLDYISEALLLPDCDPKKKIPPQLSQSLQSSSHKRYEKSRFPFLSVALYAVVIVLLLFTIRKILLKR